jgi:hypothetical protein
MHSFARAFAVVVIFVGTTVAWLTLGALTNHRQDQQERELRSRVSELWGRPHVQRAPNLHFEPAGAAQAALPGMPAGTVPSQRVPSYAGQQGRSWADFDEPAQPAEAQPTNAGAQGLRIDASRIAVELDLDQRLKGMTWYALYDVGFDGSWRYRHRSDEAGTLVVDFSFPDPDGVYDGFRFEVDGEPVDAEPSGGGAVARIPVEPEQELVIRAAYKSRGLDEWRYAPSAGAGSLSDFELVMRTDFDAIDFPSMTLSPSSRSATSEGTELVWRFEQVVTGYGIGMVMPQRLQPGELASSLSFSAPISLLFFFLVVAVLARIRGLDVHPVNYFFVAASFFAFHLLFAYSVDHLPIWLAFGLASLVSVGMVVAYLRLVVSRRFAFVEAGLAQLVYLVGFSLAHFVKGFTGLTVTLLSIATLFLLMLLTGRIRWSEVLDQRLGANARAPQANAPQAPAHGQAPYPMPDYAAHAQPGAPI